MSATKGILSYFSPASNEAAKRGRSKVTESRTSPRDREETCVTSQSDNFGTPISRAPVRVSLNEFDIVWAQIEGHPWWPGMITEHPGTGQSKKGLKIRYWHMQFFGDPPTRGWVQEKYIHPFSGLNDENAPLSVKSVTSDIRAACQEADRAIGMTESQRQDLIVFLPSDEEDMETEETRMKEQIESDGEEEEIVPSNMKKRRDGRKRRSGALSWDEKKKQAKRRKRVIVEDESEDEYQPAAKSSSDGDLSEGVPSDNSAEMEATAKTRKKKTVKPIKQATPKPLAMGSDEDDTKDFSSLGSDVVVKKSPSAAVQASAKVAAQTLLKFSCSPSQTERSKSVSSEPAELFLHETLSFLQDGKRRDKTGHLPLHPEFNPKTVYVPADFLKQQTPGMQQWWTVKSDNFDTVLFFKVGKFYELYHMDAVIGVKELGLLYMKGKFAHAGFPEISFGRYSDSLIEKGYKIGRVEQTETPQMMEERIKKYGASGRTDRVVRRELCAVVTKGTRTYGVLDGDCSDSSGAYLMAITEKPCSDVTGGESLYGVCFVDTSIGQFHIGQFADDRQCSRLRTLLAHYSPAHVLYERGRLLEKTIQLLQGSLATVIKESLLSGSEFWDARKALKFLAEGNYFNGDSTDTPTKIHWPDVLQSLLSESDSLGLTAHDDWLLGLSALGAITWCLNKCLLVEEIFSLANFTIYKPLDSHSSSDADDHQRSFPSPHQHLILDDVTLGNLEILGNSWDGSTSGTLMEILDHCSTAFGKRLFKQWLCAPPCHPDVINGRLDAVEDLMALPSSLTAGARTMLKSLPDLERQLRKIHILGSVSRSQNHPDSRAIMYEEMTYSKKKIGDLLSTLEGFSKAEEIIGVFDASLRDMKSSLLKSVLTVTSPDLTCPGFPKLSNKLSFFETAFNHELARREGVIKPAKGVNVDYDSAIATINVAMRKLDRYLEEQKSRIGSKAISYFGSGRNRYQLEVPDSFTGRLSVSTYSLQSQRKGFKRYYTSEVKDMVATLTEAEEKRDAALKDTTRGMFAEFDRQFQTWSKAVQCLSVVDVLLSMAHFSGSSDGVMCRPQFVLPDGHQQPFIEIRNGRHPCIGQTFTGGDFIPNDTSVGVFNDDRDTAAASVPCCVLVTGPNMGGKSTLMRQTGVIIIIAQLGCYVPCESCRLTPVDRVFTRLGAQDRIMSGESTFFVELSETSSILRHATEHSLVLLDELGRGTSTYDGTAIACAVVNELAHVTGCRTLFSTHYHSLVEEFAMDPSVALGHMACMVENEDSDDPTNETITFLYKFVSGACPKSYGFNAAHLAGLPDEVISVARRKAKEFESSVQSVKLFRSAMNADSNMQTV